MILSIDIFYFKTVIIGGPIRYLKKINTIFSRMVAKIKTFLITSLSKYYIHIFDNYLHLFDTHRARSLECRTGWEDRRW